MYSASGSMTESALRSSLAAQTAAMTHHTENDPFTFVGGSVGTRSLPPNTLPPVSKKPASGLPMPTPPIPPVSTIPPAQRSKEVPAGVPEYNFRMCQVDIIKMGQLNQSIVFDIPKGTSSKSVTVVFGITNLI